MPGTKLTMTVTRNTHPPDCYGDPGYYQYAALPVVPTANLPAADVSMDGRICIEDNGVGDRNIVFYAGGERFRINGGANV